MVIAEIKNIASLKAVIYSVVRNLQISKFATNEERSARELLGTNSHYLNW